MLPSNLELLHHILDEILFILDVTEGKTNRQVAGDPVLSRAIIRSLEIIGEATKKVDETLKAKYPEVEWKKMAGTRDRLIHDYFGVDYDIVWNIIQEKIPVLQSQLQLILNENDKQE